MPLGSSTTVAEVLVSSSAPRPITDAAPECAFFATLARQGYEPRAVYDVGASDGSWSESVARIWPTAAYHLFEPLAEIRPEYAAGLRSRLALRPNFALHPVALGARNEEATLWAFPDGVSSSALERDQVPGVRRVKVPLRRLDDYVHRAGLPRPSVLKLDVQGTEDAILTGAGALLDQADVLLVETWLHRTYGGRTPLLTEIVAQLWPMDFVLVRLSGPYHGDLHRLTAVDATFLSKRLLERLRQADGRWDLAAGTAG